MKQTIPLSLREEDCPFRFFHQRRTRCARIFFISLLWISLLLMAVGASASGSDVAMKGPKTLVPTWKARGDGLETSSLRLVSLAAIDVYRTRISPLQGDRCGFYPSCSSFGRQAIGGHGVLQGVVMTADRLTRCNIFKGPGPDYLLLPGGRLFDPVSANIVEDQP
jgi:putative membrane protein insertion efficiency factor